jgi:K+-sensing histidine kinase KdpD
LQVVIKKMFTACYDRQHSQEWFARPTIASPTHVCQSDDTELHFLSRGEFFGVTDVWKRRCAVNIAAQLPERKEDAQAVLAVVAEIVEEHLYPARLRLVDAVDGPRTDGPRLITSVVRPAHVSATTAMMLSLLTLIFTTPLAIIVVRWWDPMGAIASFTLGVFWAANRFGYRGAFPLVLATVPVHNFFFETPTYTITPVTAHEYYAFCGLLVCSFMREGTDLAREYVEPLVLHMFLRLAGTR